MSKHFARKRSQAHHKVRRTINKTRMSCFKLKNTRQGVALLLISLLFLTSMETANSDELAAFKDFLAANYLKHGIVLRADADLPGSTELALYQHLLENYYMQFYVASNDSLSTAKDFGLLFDYSMRRVGILVPSLQQFAQHKQIFALAATAEFFNATQAWYIVIAASQDNEFGIRQYLSGYNINIDADITVVVTSLPPNDTLLLYDVYKVSHAAATPLMVAYKGFWQPSSGFVLLPQFQQSRMLRRRDFHNITLRASTALLEKPADVPDAVYLANDKDNLQLDPMQRKTFQLLQPMQAMYNMRFDILFTDTWGFVAPNGSWSGVMAQLLRHEADFSLCPLRFSLDRMSVVHFTPELHTQFIHFLLRHPRHNNIRNIFFEPLSAQVWWCVLALVVLATALLRLLVQYERRIVPRQTQPFAESRFAYVCFTVLETALQQGPATDIFRLLSTRLLIFATCIFSFMLLQFYGAFIVGSLLSDTPRTIVNLQALYASNLQLGMENVTYNHLIFTKTSNQLIRDTYSQRICSQPSANIVDIRRGTERIKAGGFAFHAAIDRMYRILIDLLDQNEFCDLQEIMFNPPYTASAVLPKSSPLREYFAFAILHMRSTGLMQYNDKKWLVPKPDCSLVKSQDVVVDLVHFAPALFTLAAAMLCSALVFLCEVLSACYTWRRLRNWITG